MQSLGQIPKQVLYMSYQNSVEVSVYSDRENAGYTYINYSFLCLRQISDNSICDNQQQEVSRAIQYRSCKSAERQ